MENGELKEKEVALEDNGTKVSSHHKSTITVEKKSILHSSFFIFNLFLFLLIVALGVAADLGTKSWAFASLGMPREYRFHEEPELEGAYWIWEDVFGFQTSLNEGALFGMGQGQSRLFAVLSFVALAGILAWLFHSARKSRYLVITLGLIVGGVLGNLYDRLGLFGQVWPNYYPKAGEPIYAVRDWILVMIGSYHWPNFNVADSLLVCGAGLLLFHLVFFDNATPVDNSVKKTS